VGRLRDGLLRPSAQIIDICLESVDTLKKLLYRQWLDEGTMQSSVKSLLARIATLAPEEQRTKLSHPRRRQPKSPRQRRHSWRLSSQAKRPKRKLPRRFSLRVFRRHCRNRNPSASR